MKTMIIEACARAAHEANRAYCLAIGDNSQPHWEEAPQWQRDSAINGVILAVNGNTAEGSHAAWMAEKLKFGWTYGPTKDPVAKTHPCMVPYDKLPADQRAKDTIYLAVVCAMANALS